MDQDAYPLNPISMNPERKGSNENKSEVNGTATIINNCPHSVDAVVHELCLEFPNEMAINPKMVKLSALCCIKYRKFDLLTPVERLRNYLGWRYKYLNGLSDQILDAKLVATIQSCFIQILPRLFNDQAVVFIRVSKYDKYKFCAADAARSAHYVIMHFLNKHPDVCSNGVIVLCDMTSVSMKNIDMEIPDILRYTIEDCLPLNLSLALLYKPPLVVRFLVPIIKYILKEKLSERLFVITKEREFEEIHSIPACFIPIELGGEFVSYASSNIMDSLD